jgi:hypothetical protein
MGDVVEIAPRLNAAALRAAILAADDITIVPVATPEWKIEGLHAKTISGTERDRYIGSLKAHDAEGKPVVTEDSSARLVALAACDADGVLVFSQADIAVLGTKSSAALDRVVEVIAKLNGLTKAAKDDAKNDSANVPTSASSTS